MPPTPTPPFSPTVPRTGAAPDCERDAPLACLARQAARLCGAGIGLVSLLDGDDQAIVGCFGIHIDRIAAADAVCAYTVLQPDLFVVEDVAADPRFSELPAVTGAPYARFYAGVPIFDERDLPLGTVCAIDPTPHAVPTERLLPLVQLARKAAAVLRLRERLAPSLSRAELDGLLHTLVESPAHME